MSESGATSGQTGVGNSGVSHKASTEGISLLEGEQVLENLRPSWEAWWWQILVGGVLLLVGLAQITAGGIGFSLITGALTLGYVYTARLKSRYVITDERVVQRTGLLRRSSNEVRIEDIRNLKTDASIIE